MNDYTLREEPGWYGVFTRSQVEGAIPNGTRIVKSMCQPGDANPVGTHGTVLGSLPTDKVPGGGSFYFVEWDTSPKYAVGVRGAKIRPLEEAPKPEGMPMWAVYERPRDFPDEIVCRRWTVQAGSVVPDPDIFLRSRSIAEIERQLAAQGRVQIPNPRDQEPQIVSVWI